MMSNVYVIMRGTGAVRREDIQNLRSKVDMLKTTMGEGYADYLRTNIQCETETAELQASRGGEVRVEAVRHHVNAASLEEDMDQDPVETDGAILDDSAFYDSAVDNVDPHQE